jgi:hypothetical protein
VSLSKRSIARKIGKLRTSATIVGPHKRTQDRSSRKIRHSCFIPDRYQNQVTPREPYARCFTLVSFREYPMRLSLWLLAFTALSTGGCVFPCSNGACSSTGEPRYVSPAARFFGTEKLLPQKILSSQCDLGQCQPRPYLTCSKYLPFMDRWTSSSMAKRCADRYLLRQQFQTRCWISKHYKAGFRDAFNDIANGESGEVPAVPPPKYWNTHYRTEKGKRCVEQYFDGYRSGSALAAAEMTTMKTIGASYDWSIQKPKGPCASPLTNDGCAPGGSSQPNSFSAGCSTGMPPQQPSVFAVGPQMNPQPPASGIGPANSWPPQSNYQNNYNASPTPDPQFGQQFPSYQNSPAPYGAASEMLPQPSPNSMYPYPDLPVPSASRPDTGRNLNLPSPALPTPGYANPGGTFNSQPSTQNQFSRSINNQPHGSAQQPGGPLTPGFSGAPRGQVTPGKLGPPDEFQHEPPAWRYPTPQR